VTTGAAAAPGASPTTTAQAAAAKPAAPAAAKPAPAAQAAPAAPAAKPAVPAPLPPVKTVVLVHGAFADGSSWSKFIPLLEARGLHVISVQNPLTSLGDDAAAARRAIELAPGPVILVGHSWGGSVITQAGNHDKVKALVYIAAFAPSEGESVVDLGKPYPSPPGFAHIRPDSGGFLWLTPEGISKHFAQDVSKAQAKLLIATQGPIFAKAFEEKATVAAWKTKLSWYFVAEKDRMIQPELQVAMATKIKATVSKAPTSHTPFLSKPNLVAAAILAAAASVK
jgi:pimeloyl-ACP methyl ester carboxylesterase